MLKNAEFSSCKDYRYMLSREWDASKDKILIIGLNPSVADSEQDDPTMRRCIQFAKDWGYGGLYMVNLFSFVDTYQDDVWSIADPIGQDADEWILKLAKKSDKILLAWGNGAKNRRFRNRVSEVLTLLEKDYSPLFCLKRNATGMPSHPLYLSRDLKPIEYFVE